MVEKKTGLVKKEPSKDTPAVFTVEPTFNRKDDIEISPEPLSVKVGKIKDVAAMTDLQMADQILPTQFVDVFYQVLLEPRLVDMIIIGKVIFNGTLTKDLSAWENEFMFNKDKKQLIIAEAYCNGRLIYDKAKDEMKDALINKP